MWILFETGINLFQAWLLVYFMKHRLHLKPNHRIQETICILGITGILSLDYFFNFMIPDIVIFLFPLLFALTSAKDTWFVCLFWTCVLAVLFLTTIPIIANIFTSFPSISMNILLEKTRLRVVALVVTNGILGIMIWLTRLLRKDYSRCYWPALLVFFLTVISLLITEEAIYVIQTTSDNQTLNSSLFIFPYLGILLAVFLTIALFHFMSKSMDNENKYRMEMESIERTKKYTNELEMMYTKLTEIKHDIKHHYDIIGNLVIQGHHNEAAEYTKKIQSEIEQSQYRWTGSCAIDALVMTKSMSMQQNKIEFRFDPYPLSQLPIAETDFCTILGNIIDNAIEGTCRIKDNSVCKKIQLIISRSRDMLYVYCLNPYSEDSIYKIKDGWVSSKREIHKSEYGLGIRSIQRIVKGSDGRAEFQANAGLFSVKVVLPYKPYKNGERDND